MSEINYDDKVDLVVDTGIDDIFKVTASDMNQIKNAVNDNATDIATLETDKLETSAVVNEPSTETDEVYSSDYLNDKLVSVGTTAPTDGRRIWFEKSKNLFDNSTNNNLWLQANGVIVSSTGSNLQKIMCNTGETFTLSAVYPSGTNLDNAVIVLAFFDSNGTLLERNVAGTQLSLTITKTAPSNTSYMQTGHYIGAPSTIQLEKGSTATTYEPYVEKSINVDDEQWLNKTNLVSVGATSPTGGERVWFSKSKNLLPTNKYTATRTLNGVTFTNNGDGTFSVSGTASANTTMVILPENNFQLAQGQPYYFYSSVPYNASTFNLSIAMTDNGSTKYILGNNKYTPTATPTQERVAFYVPNGTSVSASNVKLMLVKGNTAPSEYEPYVNEGIYLDNEQMHFVNYSTDEQVIGKWFDGKPLYRKAIYMGAMPNNAQGGTLHNISNVDLIITAKIMMTNGTNFIPAPNAYPSNSSLDSYVYADKSRIYVRTGTDRSSYNGYAILEYTKTTD